MLILTESMTDYSLKGPVLIGLSTDKNEDSISNENELHRQLKVLVFAAGENERLLYKTLFEIWKYEVEEAKTVEQAEDLVRKNHFDVILMDTPIDISESFSVMKKLQADEELEAIPFILLSGHAQAAVRQSALAAGASAFCVKPVDLEYLKAILNSCLDIPANDDAHSADFLH